MKERESGGSQGIKRKEKNSKKFKKKKKRQKRNGKTKKQKKKKRKASGLLVNTQRKRRGEGGGARIRGEREKEGRKDNPAQISSIFFLFPSHPFHLLLLALSPPTRYRHVDHDIIPPIPSLRLLPSPTA